MPESSRRKLAVILHADVVGSTALVQKNESLAHHRIQDTFRRFSETIEVYGGVAHEIRGDAIVAEFARASDAVGAALDFQSANQEQIAILSDDIRPMIRIGISLGEVIIADGTITGAGVVLAQRLEQLADSGGVVVQGAISETVPTRLPFDFESLGERRLKGFDKPVRPFVARLKAGQQLPSPEADTAHVPIQESPNDVSGRSDNRLPNTPSIAVLPFTNMSGDPQQEYFSDGITENIIANLSRFHDLFVIARNSTSVYKGKAAKIQDISRELGVRYILEGSVHMSGDQVRINAQLIDGPTGRHLWVERYQRQVEDIFALQDEVTETIVGTLASGYGGRLRKAWQKQAQTTRPKNVQAFDCFMRGLDSWDLLTKEDNLRAREYLEEAIRLDPGFAKAFSKLAWTHISDAIEGWGDDYESSIAKAKECAIKAIDCDDGESWGHWALAACHIYEKRFDLALPGFQKAIDLNPNDADALMDYGYYISYAGRAEEGLEAAHKAMRLNPHHPEWYKLSLAQICFDARQYEDAVAAFRSVHSVETVASCLYMAAALAALGLAVDAEVAIESALELDPRATLRKWTDAKMAPYKDPKDLGHFREYVQKAGLPN
jgi:adenylate cyclase